jgi:glycerol-3-phosphate dehydrogenase (NAD(P)+)
MSISVLGCGAWGTALATMLADNSVDTMIWGRDADIVHSINNTRRNPAYLGEIPLSETLVATSDLALACCAQTLLCATPAQSFGALVQKMEPFLVDDSTIVLCAKGIDRTTGKLLHELAAEFFGADRVAALSGPSFAVDVARGLPTAVSLAANSLETANSLSASLARPRFRIYSTNDLIGVEIGGALKNVLALAVGISRGLELGASAEAALIARGFAELDRVACAMGARHETLAGLSGLGDLVLSCSNPQSRNFSYGIALARGEDLSGLPLAEGVHSADMALQLALRFDLKVPIIEMVVRVLAAEVTPREAVSLLLARPLKGEV